MLCKLPYKTDETVPHFSWKTKIEQLSDGRKSITVVKEMETVQFATLVENFNDMLSKAKCHIGLFNIRHQYLQYRYLLSQLDHCSCMLHIDFAKNYNMSKNREIQSVHFGGLHCQTAMHTGVL